MTQYGYRDTQNPFDHRDDSQVDGYAASGNVEMASLAHNASSFASGDPNAILNECRSIDRGIDQIDQNLNQLRMLQDRSLNEAEASGSSTSRQLDSLASETMALYRQLTERVRQVKSQREAQQPKNSPQVGRVDRRLKQAIQSYQQVESAFRKKTQDQMARQYRIVRPDATESEVRAVVEDTSAGGQVFQQAMMQSDRRGQARAVLSAVQDRHAALQKIEEQMVELAQLFQDMDTLIIQQDAQVMQIEQKAEEAVENLDKGNEEIGVAVVTAKKTRKKKWICLGISGHPPVAMVYGQSKTVRDNGRSNTAQLSSRYVINTDFAAGDGGNSGLKDKRLVVPDPLVF
ncbi:snare protein nsyn1 [Grosmannia clavigera kw1407]|uniref:Snare protein nsyn1 n=1 Tax=Grosmannia clavigera (strain kw1407 / UAMH 11150) TaxID=655863 RepID=F0XJX5_GROCL|nr:snare protein nsyn1 [Grosmannia clavigera kw1407]EFX01963.1 snare protein nsyn1 [Grosmannia clavigera kw1407]